MGSAPGHFKRFSLDNRDYQIQKREKASNTYGGYGNLLDKRDGNQTRGYFRKQDKQPLVSGLVYVVRHACNQQSYAGFHYPNDATCSGRIGYQKESEASSYYMGTHVDRTAREGFGLYKYPRKWSYLGFWSQQQMEGFGMLRNFQTRERYTGEFKSNQIEGWGEYERIIRNKVLKTKGKTYQGIQNILIWANFKAIDPNDTITRSLDDVDPQKNIRYFKMERRDQVFYAFPRIQEIEFQSKRLHQYKLRLITEIDGKLVVIKRKGWHNYQPEVIEKQFKLSQYSED